jgi:UDP-N-acetylmuramate dehydrogenase
LLLKKDDLKKIKNKLIDFSTRRWEKQPIDLPSAGSIFKRPKPDFFVGTAIENLGLKGFSIGEAQISTKHAGFIINKGNATFNDVISLIEYVKRIVKDEYNVDLQVEPEIWK